MEHYNLNHSVIHNMAEAVPQDEDVTEIFANMLRIMIKNRGIGLAAPQIGLSKRLIITQVKGRPQAIINPKLSKPNLGVVPSTEGCLSYPGMQVKILRNKMITVSGFDDNWNPVKFKLRGLEAFCVQHEVDHLNGVTIKDHKGRP